MNDENSGGSVPDQPLDPAALIGEALGRLRSRRRGLQGRPSHDSHTDPRLGREHGGRGGVHGGGGSDGQGPHDERFTRRGGGPGRRSPEPYAGDPRLSRGLGGPPAIVRTIEALAKAKEPLGVNEIADAVGVDQPRASRLVQQGVARGLFAREADPDDARRTRIALTEQGLRFAHGIRNHQRESLNTALESFTDDEQVELARLLTKLANSWPT